MQIKSAIHAIPLKTLSVFFTALFLVTFPQVASSQELQLKVQTRMPYAENNDQGDRRELVHQFKKDAFKKMMSDPNTPLAKARLIEQYFDEMTDYETIDRFFTKYVFAGKCDTGSGSSCGVVKDQAIVLQGMAFMSMNAIDNFIQSKSAASTMDSSEFATLFIARTVEARKIFKEKQTDVEKTESTSSVEVVSGGDDISTVTGGSSEEMSVSSSGGSTVQRSDVFTYKINQDLSKDLQFAVQETFVNAGFRTFPADEVLYYYDMDGLDEFIENGQFGDDGTLRGKTLASVKRTINKDGVKFLVTGVVDYRKGEKNPVTGGMRVPASVKVEVVMADGRRMVNVASVKPTIIFGDYQVGEDEAVGRLVAQNRAVKQAMDTIVSQLQAQGLY